MLRILPRHIAAAAFVIVAVGMQVLISYEYAGAIFLGSKAEPRSPIGVASFTDEIDTVDPSVKDVAKGDHLLAVNGAPFAGQWVLSRTVHFLKPGDSFQITVQPKGSKDSRAMTLPVLAAKSSVFTWNTGAVVGIVFILILPPFCVLLASAVVILKSWDPRVWFFAFLMLSFAYVLLNATAADAPYWQRVFSNGYFMFLRMSWPAWLALFTVSFPDRLRLDIRWPWLKWLLIVPSAVWTVLAVATRIEEVEDWRTAAALNRLRDPQEDPYTLYALVVSVLFLAAVAYRLATTRQPDARRRLKLLLAGAVVGIGPFISVYLWASLTKTTFSTNDSPWAAALTLGPFPLFPLTLAYLVVVHRALDIRMAIRQGVQHALARRGVVVLQILVTMAALSIAVLATGQANTPQRISAIALAITFVLAARGLADKVRVWIDRRFFRDAYRAEQVLSELSESVRHIVETRPLIETVTRQIAETLHIDRIAVLLAQSGSGAFVPAYALGYAETPAVEFAPATATVRELERATAPVRVYFDDPASWLNRPTGPDSQERRNLTALDAQVLLPLSIKQRVLGFLSLGPKRSEQPYSGTDLRLLSTVAGQTGLALENSLLAATVAEQSASRERLNRELEIAREVQRRFFPQKQPAVAGLDYAGLCRPAQSVGGDYYDFRTLTGGRLGVTIGDVAGKGAPAALLMASLQASLRTQAIAGGTADLARVLENVNTLSREIATASRFSTLFYARYDPSTRRLAYVNAGHNPPMLIRAGKSRMLETGGLAIGLSRNAKYFERELALEPGDVLVAYTDGVTEAMNADRDDFGETRLEQTVNACVDRPASVILNQIVVAVDAFAGGAPQHDDITLVVLKVLA
jgi:phosphoserine phosphatase RsbU/P